MVVQCNAYIKSILWSTAWSYFQYMFLLKEFPFSSYMYHFKNRLEPKVLSYDLLIFATEAQLLNSVTSKL